MTGALQAVQPYLLAMLVCDQVIVDEMTKKKTLVGVFDRLYAAQIPTVHTLALYARITDAEGQYVFRIDQVHVQTGRRIGHVETGEVNLNDRLRPFELVIQLGAGFDAMGQYEFRLLANRAYLGRATVDVEPRPSAQ